MKDIKINDAAYFPRPQAIYKALPIARTMGEAAAEYMAGWEFNGLIILASAGELADVIICALIAAKRDGIDIERAVSLKMQINAQRAAMQGDKL